MLAFTLGISILTGVLFGLLPAVHVSRLDVNSALKESSGRSATGLKQNRIRGMLVVSEIALALVLLIGAALMIRTFAGLRSVKPGFDPVNVLTFQTSLTGGRYDKTAEFETLVRQVMERVEGLPGVQSAANVIVLPFTYGVDLSFTVDGRVPANGKMEGDEFFRPVSSHYFSVLRIPVLRGRVFDQQDTSRSPHVVIINEAFAKKYWKQSDPIGQRITIGHGLGPEFEEGPREIVGIVGSVHEGALSDASPVMYIPAGQTTDGITKLANGLLPTSWILRAQSDPLSLATAIQRELRAVDGQLYASKIRTMERLMSDSTAQQSFDMLLLTVFAAIALLLAAVGIYGLLSYTVQQRTQEIGIRMALGASRGQMLGLILTQGMRLAVIGVVIGLAAAFGLTRFLEKLLVGVKANDPLTFAVVAAVLISVAIIAALVPARRATAVDPVLAIRNE